MRIRYAYRADCTYTFRGQAYVRMKTKPQLAERDDKGNRLRVRVSTTVYSDNYNWVRSRLGVQFDKLLDRKIEELRGIEAEALEKETPRGRFKTWLAERNALRLQTTTQQIEAKKLELGA